MKKITVGRGNDCDIVIPDERDNVSRHHMVISFNMLGKMTISDTSSNGTFINERRMLKGTSIPVTRNDKIRLGDRWNFDWSLVKDPYVTMRKTMIAAASLLVVIVIAAVWFVAAGQSTESETTPAATPKEYVEQGKGEWNKDSTNKVAPTEMSIPIGTKAAAGGNAGSTGRHSSRKQSTSKAGKAKNNTVQTKASANVNTRTDNMPVIN